MSDWVRPLFRVAGVSSLWHSPRTKGFTTTTYCDEDILGPIEVGSEGKAEHEGRCRKCTARLAARRRGAVPRTRSGAVKRAPSSGRAATVKKAIKKPAPKKRAAKAPAAKRPVRRPRRRGA